MTDSRQPFVQAVSIAAGASLIFHLDRLGSSEGLAGVAAGYGLALGVAAWLSKSEQPRATDGYVRPWERKMTAIGTIAIGLFGVGAAFIGAFVWFNRAKKAGASSDSSVRQGGFDRFEARISALQDRARANGQVDLAAKLEKFARTSAVLEEVVKGPDPTVRPATGPLPRPGKAPTRPLDAPRPRAATRPLPPEPVVEAPAPEPLDNWGLSTAASSATSDLDRWGLSTTIATTTTTSTSSIADTYGQPAVSGFDEALAILQGKQPEDLHR